MTDIVREALRHVIDPELGVNIVDLGLVYRVDVVGPRVRVEMTMTSPACPLGEYLRDLVDSTIKWRVPGIEEVEIALVFDPRWNADMMSADARRQLFGENQ
jgi:metal-sulfur cluster biosynthetic enzyme